MNFSKIFKFFFIAIFFIGIISPLFIPINQAKATINFCPQIDIPGIKMFDTKTYKCTKDKDGNITGGFPIDTDSIALLAAGAYKFIAGIAGIAAVIVMMAGGYVWLFAGGNASKVGEAKSLITSAVLGLFLVLGSYMILNLINPELIKLKSLDDIGGITQIKIDTASKICTKPERDAFAKEKKIDTVDQQTCGQVYKRKGAEDCINISCPYASDSICLLMIDSNGEYSGKGCVNSVTAAYGATMSDATSKDIPDNFKVTGYSFKNDNPINISDDCGIVDFSSKTVGGFCGPISAYKDNTCYLVSAGNRIENGPAAFLEGDVTRMHSKIPGKVYSNGKAADAFRPMECEK